MDTQIIVLCGKEEVPFTIDPLFGEIRIVSTNPRHTDENCIVTVIQVDKHGKLNML